MLVASGTQQLCHSPRRPSSRPEAEEGRRREDAGPGRAPGVSRARPRLLGSSPPCTPPGVFPGAGQPCPLLTRCTRSLLRTAARTLLAAASPGIRGTQKHPCRRSHCPVSANALCSAALAESLGPAQPRRSAQQATQGRTGPHVGAGCCPHREAQGPQPHLRLRKRVAWAQGLAQPSQLSLNQQRGSVPRPPPSPESPEPSSSTHGATGLGPRGHLPGR